MRPLLLLSLLLALSCAHNTGSPHSAVDYPDVKLDAQSISVSVSDPRKQDDIPDGHYRVALPPEFEGEAAARLQHITSGKGLALSLVITVTHADSAPVDTMQGRKVHIDVAFDFKLQGPDGTKIKTGKGSSWGEIPEEQAGADEVAKIVHSTALNAFDQYWADEEVLNRINGNIAQFRDRKGL